MKVFISGTKSDLTEHRHQVIDACLRLGFHPLMMETFPAMPGNPVHECEQMVEQADYDLVGNLFRLGRHLTRAIHYREFCSRAFCEWQEVTCAQNMA